MTEPTEYFDFKWNGTDWTQEAGYVVGYDIEYGFPISDDNFLFQPVADVGTATIILDNETGRFLPENTSSAIYPNVHVGVRFRYKLSGATMYEGDIIDITTIPGPAGKQLCIIEIEDDIAKLSRVPVEVALITDHPVSDAIEDLVELGFTPTLTDYEYNGDEIPVYGRTWNPENTSALKAIQSICQTYFGWFYIGYPFGAGPYATYKTKQFFQDRHFNAGWWVDGMTTGGLTTAMEISESGRHIRNRINVWYYPEEELGSTVVLYDTQGVLGLGVGRTRKYFLKYRNPDTGEDVASTDVEDLTATTDYVINKRVNGSGTDVTNNPNIAISFEIQIQQMIVTVTNNTSFDIFFQKLQCRGKPIIVYDPIKQQYDDTNSQDIYSLRAERVDMITGLPNDIDDKFGTVDLGALWLAYLAYPQTYCNFLSIDVISSTRLFYEYYIKETETKLDGWHRLMRIRFHDGNTDFWFIPGRFYAVLMLNDTTYGVLNQNRLGV